MLLLFLLYIKKYGCHINDKTKLIHIRIYVVHRKKKREELYNNMIFKRRTLSYERKKEKKKEHS